ncbi:hypothetical protein QO259_17275 [Salinicola sp. JS01]|uniref:hypothetical protein n=1 Tax=Salinicola sp. JS01 TaxID=3050071 RepID=UPI00255BCED6|nr:hypothetical protein [Salinicola sp. JS01]WIX32540.1 hypothetical protein QO259_17275 [Salinicola sp. JS01]
MAKLTTDQKLDAILVMQAEILGRVEKLEKRVGRENARGDALMDELVARGGVEVYPSINALSGIESLIDTDTGDAIISAIDDLALAVSQARN